MLADEIRAAAELTSAGWVVSLTATKQLAERSGVSRREVEIAALAAEIAPSRYLRSLGTVGLAGQRKLLESRAVVVGAGGLGGYIIEGLARMGVGRIHVVDGDRFADHNLNRQLLCTEAQLGRPKAEVASERVSKVNGAVEVVNHPCYLDAANADDLLADADIVLDALDNVPSRLLLQDAAGRLGIPFIHGAIAGFYAQVTTICPGDPGLRRFYRGTDDRAPGEREGDAPTRGIETTLGNPAATPMLCAALEVHEAIKVLLGLGAPLRDRLLTIDALHGEATTLILE